MKKILKKTCIYLASDDLSASVRSTTIATRSITFWKTAMTSSGLRLFENSENIFPHLLGDFVGLVIAPLMLIPLIHQREVNVNRLLELGHTSKARVRYTETAEISN